MNIPFKPDLALFRSLLPAIVSVAMLFSPALQAQPLACGVYLDADSGARLEVLDAQRARILRDDLAPQTLRYRLDDSSRDDRVLKLYDVDNGYVDAYTLSADLRTATGEEATFRKRFVLQQATECPMVKQAPPGRCERDLDACFAGIEAADEATLAAYCAEDLPFACVRLIERYQNEVERAAQTDAVGEPPPECREGTPTFDAKACEAAIGRMLGETLSAAFATLYADDRPLPAARLDTLPALCERSGSAKVCGLVAEKLWTGERYVDARAALRTACERGEDPDACRRLAPLADLADAALRVVPANALPCGRYVADGGLMSEFEFGDRGLVTSVGAQLRARLEAGAIRMRHDKGGDFVLRPLADGRLIGVDSWNRYALYRRDGGATRCAAPVVYEEKPLIQDCPQPGAKTPQACCDAGSLHGCNIVGHQLALGGRWAEARPYYLKVCAGGVRIGCENLTKVYANSGDGAGGDEEDGDQAGEDSIIEDLRALCARDPKHVACDVAETTDWAGLLVGRAFGEALRQMEAEEATSEDAAQDEQR